MEVEINASRQAIPTVRATVELATQLVESYCAELGRTVGTTRGWDPFTRDGFDRQFLLGNGGCWSVGISVATNLRGKVPASGVARPWHPHDVAAAVTMEGFARSYARLLVDDAVGEGDVVHLISGSGRSANLLVAAEVAVEKDAHVIAHCGHDGGQLRARVAEGVQVDSFDQQAIEDTLMLRLWPARAEDDRVIMMAIESVTSALRAEAEQLARAAAALVSAIKHDNPVGVLAIDSAVVSASAEHVAHNLRWDMCWDLPPLRPQVHFALSNALLTAVANDSGRDSEPFEHVLGPARSRGLVLNLGRHRGAGLTSRNSPEEGIAPESFESLRLGASRIGLHRVDCDYLCAVFVQMWGHVLVRLGRTLVREHEPRCDSASRLQGAQRPIAPRTERDD